MQQGIQATKIVNDGSPVQREFSELRMKDARALPTHLFRDEFSFGNSSDPSVTNAMRLINWSRDYGISPLIVSGPLGIGKSTLAWQAMSEADSRGLVPIMVGAADLVMGNDFSRSEEHGRGLPRSSIKTLEATLEKLCELKERGVSYGKSFILIIDGVDPSSYSPFLHRAGNSSMKRIQSLEIPVIMTVDSDNRQLTGGSIDGFLRILNPENPPKKGVVLTRDIEAKKTLTLKNV